MAVIRLIFLAMLFAASSCAQEIPNKEDEVQSQIVELAAAREKWLAHAAGQRYSFDFERNCFCLFPGRQWHVEVRGSVTSFALVDDLEPKSDQVRDAWLIPTIPEIHDDILRKIEKNLSRSATLRVEYDKRLGYPTLIDWNAYPGGDDYLIMKISNVLIE